MSSDDPIGELETERLFEGTTAEEEELVELPVIIIGTGAEARAAAEILQLFDRVVYGFVTAGKVPDTLDINHIPVLGRMADGPYLELLQSQPIEFVIAEPIAADRIRLQQELFTLTQRLPITLIHPASYVAASADVAAGVIVQAGCVVGEGVRIEALTQLGLGVIVDAEAEIGRACTLQLGVRVGHKAVLEDEAFIGAGALVHSGIRVERGGRVGAGSLVMKSVRAGDSVFGVPAVSLGGQANES